MGLYRMFDAAFPPGLPYPGCQAAAGYIGGNTPHVWSLAEWQRFAGLVQFPIWTGYGQGGDGATQGLECAAVMHQLGWKPGAPNRRGVILDEETRVDPAWVDGFAGAIWDSGYQTFMYGSLATILSDPPKEGYLVADWNDIPALPPYPNVVGCQYQPNIPWNGTQVDLSVITDAMMLHGGIGARG